MFTQRESFGVWHYESIMQLAARFTPEANRPCFIFFFGLAWAGHEDTFGGRPFSPDGNSDDSSERQMLRNCSPFCGKCTQKRSTACMQT